MNGFERQVQINGSFFLGLDILYSYRCIFIYHLFVYLFFSVCGKPVWVVWKKKSGYLRWFKGDDKGKG